MDPTLLHALCGMLIVLSLGIQHGLQTGTFPAELHALEPFRSFLACVPGIAAGALMALATGVTWQQALAAGLAGCSGALQGAFAAFWPSASSSSGGGQLPPATPTLPSAQPPAGSSS
jgi:ABC-type nitrate/sulfonate/bicarbonate transport system permease component